MRSDDLADLDPIAPVSASTSSLTSFTVVIPCFNAAKWIARAVHSVLDQAYPAAGVIVVDDGSSDGSLAEIKAFGDRISWLTGENRGSGAARNRGLALAHSDCVVFLDADDYQTPGYLHAAGKVFQDTRADMIFASTLSVFDDKPAILSNASRFCEPLDTLIPAWIMGDMAQTGTVIWKTSFIRRIGGWNDSVLIAVDWEMGLRGLIAQPCVSVAEEAVAAYVHHLDPGRMAFRTDDRTAEGLLRTLGELSRHPYLGHHPEARRALGARLHGLARYCFNQNSESMAKVGARALEASRRLTHNSEFGNIVHRTLARSIGLRRKERLFKLARSMLGIARNAK